MDEQSLPERLREIAETLAAHGADNPMARAETCAALTGAADELERLALERAVDPTEATPRDTYLGDRLGDFAAPAGHVFAAIVLPVAEAMRLAGGDPDPSGTGLELDALGRELAGDAGVAVPMPTSLWFGATFDHFDPPSPGSFVFAGPALAVWRVLNVDRLPDSARGDVVAELRPTHAIELEPVDAHDVPISARVAEIPQPVVTLEVVDGVSSDAG